MENGCWGGLVILMNIQPVHRSRTWQAQLFEGVLEYQLYLDIVLTIMIGVTGFGQQSVLGSPVASEKQLGADHPSLFKKQVKNSWGQTHHSSKRIVEGCSTTKGYRGTVSTMFCKHGINQG
jgi:hypothetical protein